MTKVLDASDLGLLREMLRVFAEAFDNRDAYLSRPPSDDYLAELLGRDTFTAIVAVEDGRVVGGLAGYTLHKFEQQRSEFYLYDLAVLEAYRRRGIATALIETLKTLALARRIGVIFVQADAGDDPAIALYTRLGTREDVMHFDILPASGRG